MNGIFLLPIFFGVVFFALFAGIFVFIVYSTAKTRAFKRLHELRRAEYLTAFDPNDPENLHHPGNAMNHGHGQHHPGLVVVDVSAPDLSSPPHQSHQPHHHHHSPDFSHSHHPHHHQDMPPAAPPPSFDGGGHHHGGDMGGGHHH